MRLIFTDHLKTRLKQRKISAKFVREVFKQNPEKYWDTLRKHNVIVGDIFYEGSTRKVLVAYDTIGNTVEVITIHKVTEEQIKQRLNSRRWIHEKNKSN